MLRPLQSRLSGLQPTLRLFSSSRVINPCSNKVIVRSFQAQQASLRVTAHHCFSTARNLNMASNHLETSNQRIFDNNRKWVESMKAEDADFFVKLGSGQNPEYLFVFPKSHCT
jgi:hypothetical protein